jgi:hypothetical protein
MFRIAAARGLQVFLLGIGSRSAPPAFRVVDQQKHPVEAALGQENAARSPSSRRSKSEMQV